MCSDGGELCNRHRHCRHHEPRQPRQHCQADDRQMGLRGVLSDLGELLRCQNQAKNISLREDTGILFVLSDPLKGIKLCQTLLDVIDCCCSGQTDRLEGL